MTDPARKTRKKPENPTIAKEDRELFSRMNREKLYQYISMQIKNLWRVDGLYFLGIEKRHDKAEATEVDAECWRYMARAEATDLLKFLGSRTPCEPAEILRLLRYTSWSMAHRMKSWRASTDGSVAFTVENCHTQNTRLEKGLEPHPCRRVREPYLKAFVKELNPKVEVVCQCCPPDREREDIWCEWVFRWA